MDEYNRLNDVATRREEWMAAQAIITGEIPIKGVGVSENIDFQFTNKIVLTGNEKWGASGAKILDNLGDWVDLVLTNGFANVDQAIFGKQTIRLLMANSEIQKRMDNKNFRIGEINPRDLPNGVRYYGHLNDPNLDLYGYGEVYLDGWIDPKKPETKPLVPDNALVLDSSNPGFMLAYGASTYIDEKGAWVTAQTARPLPIPSKADRQGADVC